VSGLDAMIQLTPRAGYGFFSLVWVRFWIILCLFTVLALAVPQLNIQIIQGIERGITFLSGMRENFTPNA
jgi:hypothetical protein